MWKELYNDILKTDRMVELKKIIKKERVEKIIIPEPKETFSAFGFCPYEKLRVVIVGPEPFPHKDHADGLAFSSKAEKTPKSLSNIFSEIERQLYPTRQIKFKSNSLKSWAEQGVLLLNRTLTVEHGNAGSHADLDWKHLTDALLKKLCDDYPKRLCFVLVGEEAEKLYGTTIHTEKHEVLIYPDPKSPEWANNDMFIKIQEFCRDLFFADLKEKMCEVKEVDLFVEVLIQWFQNNGVNLQQESAEMVFKFILGSIGPYLADVDTNIKTLYEINFVT